MDAPRTDWSLSCYLCHKSFLTSQTIVNDQGFVRCPHCGQWSGNEYKQRNVRVSRCNVFVEPTDRLIGDCYVWMVVNPQTTLQGLCGVMIDNVPQRAIGDSLAEAMKFVPFLARLKKTTGHRFKLVRFRADEVYADL